MTNTNIRPIFGPAPTFGQSDVQKAQAQSVGSRSAGPTAPDAVIKPSVANFQAHFLARPNKVLTFGSNKSGEPVDAPNLLKNDVATGYEDRSTEDLWRELVAGAAKLPEVYKHFAFTPPHITNLVLDAADIQKGDRVLEPCAGTGCMTIPLALRSDHVEATEAFPMLQELLKRGAIRYDMSQLDPDLVEKIRTEQAKFTLLPGHDFLAMDVPKTDAEKYDKVIVSPPHGGGELDHIKQAYDFLKPGGTLVAIMPRYALTLPNDLLDSKSLTMVDAFGNTRTGNQYRQFREWYEAHVNIGHGTCIKRDGKTGSRGKSDFRQPFIKYDIGNDGQVIETVTSDLNILVVKIKKPENACIPLVLDPSIPVEKPAAQDNVTPIRPEHKLVVNG